jgi:hypothetical protein
MNFKWSCKPNSSIGKGINQQAAMETEGSITYDLVREINDNFSEAWLHGQGAFRPVYRVC